MYITAVIPTLNPTDKLVSIIDELIQVGFINIIVVNDGSNKDKEYIFKQISNYKECSVLTHNVNKGKGAAIKTALNYYKNNNSTQKGIVILDDDGQHKTQDIYNCANNILEHDNSLILGTRNFNKDNVPTKSMIGNKISCLLFKLFVKENISDTQTGLRGIPNKLIDICINTKGERYEYETNMLLEVKKYNKNIKEVSIETVYFENNKASHFRPITDSYLVFKQILLFIISSLSASLIDCLLFTILVMIINFNNEYINVLLSVSIARIVSSLYNYYFNRYKVFNAINNDNNSMYKYFALCLIQIFISSVCINTIFNILNINIVLIKIIVDSTLFIVNYYIQKYWVFKKEYEYV